MFKRKPRSYGQQARDMVYPRGGWKRAATYVWHRMRRLPDQPHRIARGAAAGVFISFTPLFGIHLLGGAALAWLIGGNVLAAVLGTFVGNPVTIPFIAMMALPLGRWLLGVPGQIGPRAIFVEFERATRELWHNAGAIFTDEKVHWGDLAQFFEQVFWPYMVGGVITGTIAAVATHYLTLPIINAYHKRRARKMEARIARLRDLPPKSGGASPPAPPEDI